MKGPYQWSDKCLRDGNAVPADVATGTTIPIAAASSAVLAAIHEACNIAEAMRHGLVGYDLCFIPCNYVSV